MKIKMSFFFVLLIINCYRVYGMEADRKNEEAIIQLRRDLNAVHELLKEADQILLKRVIPNEKISNELKNISPHVIQPLLRKDQTTIVAGSETKYIEDAQMTMCSIAYAMEPLEQKKIISKHTMDQICAVFGRMCLILGRNDRQK